MSNRFHNQPGFFNQSPKDVPPQRPEVPYEDQTPVKLPEKAQPPARRK